MDRTHLLEERALCVVEPPHDRSHHIDGAARWLLIERSTSP